MKLVIIRSSRSELQTIGSAFAFDDNGILLSSFATLELGWYHNSPHISCIPAGKYILEKRFPEKHKHHFWVKNVLHRSWILIHAGNFFTQTKGCILIGISHDYLNTDLDLDVASSKFALQHLNNIAPFSFELQIFDAC